MLLVCRNNTDCRNGFICVGGSAVVEELLSSLAEFCIVLGDQDEGTPDNIKCEISVQL